MTPTLVWNDEPDCNAWTCSCCVWKNPVPTFLSDPEAKQAYDRLAASKFGEHICELPAAQREIEDTSTAPTFTKRVMKLLKVGYKPKDAVQIAIDEIGLEYRNDSKIMTQARADAQDFMLRVREGRI
jgi:hypothetical protein